MIAPGHSRNRFEPFSLTTVLFCRLPSAFLLQALLIAGLGFSNSSCSVCGSHYRHCDPDYYHEQARLRKERCKFVAHCAILLDIQETRKYQECLDQSKNTASPATCQENNMLAAVLGCMSVLEPGASDEVYGCLGLGRPHIQAENW